MGEGSVSVSFQFFFSYTRYGTAGPIAHHLSFYPQELRMVFTHSDGWGKRGIRRRHIKVT